MYVCPVCRKRLKRLGNVWHCQFGHSFDISGKGYVNLLTTAGRNPKNAGDNAEMVRARTEFLDRGYYRPLAEKTADIMASLLENTAEPKIIDSGCGEGYYTCIYADRLKNASFWGIDISKKAVAHCASRARKAALSNCEFAVASSFELPFRDHFADLIVCTFAPVANDEYARKLRHGGRLVVVSPSPRHLFELKSVLYDQPYENKPNIYGLNKFDLTDEVNFEYAVTLKNSVDIQNLFTMTPYYYKTSAESAARLNQLDSLEVTCGFTIQTYTKKRGF
ncbi:MAG: methyltransferase domain-containing protein [Ruminococcus sp.]|nr:methyltransferase domain-containing protein [Ruminococcus sp.]